MKSMVYVVPNAGSISTEKFESDQAGSNFAKSCSNGLNTMCTVYKTSNSKVFFYENGEICNAARKAELSKIIEETIYYEMNREKSRISKR